MNMRILYVFILLVFPIILNAQELKNVVFAQNDSIQLLLRDFCKDEVTWQESLDGETWSDVTEFSGNGVHVSIADYSFQDKLLRAKIKYSSGGPEFYSYPFSVSIISSFEEIEIGDYYSGTFIYAEIGDTLLGGELYDKGHSWGCHIISVAGTSDSIGAGKNNTKLISENCQNSAAAYIDTLVYKNKNDWFLPSIFELIALNEAIFSTIVGQDYSEDTYRFYWSSTELDQTRAKMVSYKPSNLEDQYNKNQNFGLPISRYFVANESKINSVETSLPPSAGSNVIYFERDSTYTNIFRSSSDILTDTSYNFDWDFGNAYSVTPIMHNQYELEYKWNTFTGWHDHIAVIDTFSNCKTDFQSNTIKPEFFTKSQTLRSISDGDMNMADFDNDSQEDIIIAQSGILIYQNIAGQFDTVQIIPDPLVEPIVITPDINNDGLADILVMGSEDGSPEVHSYLNMGEFQFQEVENSFTGQLSGDIESIDLNNDGVLEILISGMNQDSILSFTIYSYNSTTDEYENIPSNVPGLYNCEIVVEDIDGDQDSDILILGKNEAGRNTLIFKNEGGNLAGIENNIIPLSDGDVAFFHFNDDEYLDVAVTGERADVEVEINSSGNLSVYTTPAATLKIYTQDSINQFTLRQTLEKLDAYYNSDIDIGDYDGDGDYDLFVSGGIGGLQWVSVRIGGGTPVVHQPSLTGIHSRNGESGFTTIKADVNKGYGGASNYHPNIPQEFVSDRIFTSDFNNDYQIEFIRGGNGRNGLSTDLFLNTSSCTNLPPSQPSSIFIIDSCDHVSLSWDAAIDDITALGLKYQYSLKQVNADTYVFSPANDHQTYSQSIRVNDLPNGDYVFAVKAIDGSKVSSPYAEFLFTVEIPDMPTIAYNGNQICADVSDGQFEWYLNGEIIANENDNCITPTQNGEYFCLAVEEGCISDTSNVINYIATSIADDFGSNNIKLYPNPSSGRIQIETDIDFEKISVFNSMGQSVLETNYTKILDLSSLPNGTYILSLDGSIQKTFTIQR
jgi:hypothetical protein